MMLTAKSTLHAPPYPTLGVVNLSTIEFDRSSSTSPALLIYVHKVETVLNICTRFRGLGHSCIVTEQVGADV